MRIFVTYHSACLFVLSSFFVVATLTVSIYSQNFSASSGTVTLPTARVQEGYSTTLTSTFGKAPYAYTILTGALPSGLSMSSLGKISGKSANAGTYTVSIRSQDSSTPPQSQTTQYSLNVSVGLDAYGGLTALRSPNGASGYFRAEKLGGRWTLVSPLGNDFWLTAVCVANESTIPNSKIKWKYGSGTNDPNWNLDVQTWAMYRGLRMQNWGFNSLGEYTGSEGTPIASKYYPANKIKLPFIVMFNALLYEMNQPSTLGLPEQVKNIVAGVPYSTYSGYRGLLPDVFDPKFQQGYQATLAFQQQYYPNFGTSPWVLGITLDDSDELSPLKTVDSGHPHPIYMIATAMFSYTWQQNPKHAKYQDPVLHSKYAWSAFLQQEYGTIAKLNAAWGSNYTTFGDSGGYGSGTGLLDEDGRHTQWMGNDPISLSNAAPQVAADMNSFLYRYGYQYASIAVTTIRSYDKHHLIIGPNMLNKMGVATRPQFVQALADAGVNVLALGYNPATGDMSQNNATYDQVGLPAFFWYSLSANADSPLHPYVSSTSDYPSQAARAQQYDRDLQTFYASKGANGDHYVLGIDWWALTDGAPTQQTNWGLITNNDNAYDGVQNIRVSGRDQWGFRTGGESRNYGNFLGPVTQTNTDILEQLIVDQQAATKKKQ